MDEFGKFLKEFVKGDFDAFLPFQITLYGRSFDEAIQSLVVPGCKNLEIDLSKIAPNCNYKIIVVCTENEQDEQSDVVNA